MAKLYFYYASMNAGKSALLLQTAFNYRERGMDVSLWTAAVDNRPAFGAINSRIGLTSDALPIPSSPACWWTRRSFSPAIRCGSWPG